MLMEVFYRIFSKCLVLLVCEEAIDLQLPICKLFELSGASCITINFMWFSR